MPLLFLSYRRGDHPDTVKLIHERLTHRLPRWEVFYDHESIPLGEQFPERLRAKATSATAMLVFIGPRWIELLQERKQETIDHVRAEVQFALESGASVVPVLIGRAVMPTDADLAEFLDLQPLLKRHGRAVRPDPDFDGDLEPIFLHLESLGAGETVGATLAGKYTLTGEIGAGGMGVVYAAEQKQPVKRMVAVKLIKPGMDSRDVLARFDAERQALAVMNHPNIAKVLDAGLAASGRPFFVMEYVQGVSITEYCDEKKLTPRERVELFIPICRALQHAHQKGILHRDIKPGNVLVEVIDGKPIPKIIDFGLAKALGHKLTDKTLHTTFETRVGTLEYSSPEQTAGRSFDVDARSDVYSLGALLYELLAGVPPFTRAELLQGGEEEMRRVIREVEPIKPSSKVSSARELVAIAAKRQLEPAKLKRLLRGDLDWVVLKCLEKDRARRYVSALDLAEDLQRWLDGEAVVAHRQTLVYRLGKRLRKHRYKVAALAVAALLAFAAWIGLADGGYLVPGSAHVQEWLDRHEASVLRPVPSPGQLEAAADHERRALREHLLHIVAANEGWSAPAKKNPDAWSQMQMTVALFANPKDDREQLQLCVQVLDRIFEPNGRCPPFVAGFGWPYKVDGNCSAEASAWALSALAKVLAAPEVVSPDERARLLERLDQVQTALDSCRSKVSGAPRGGWNLFAQQDDPSQDNIYVTEIVCQGLLELRRADLPWHKSREDRDRLLVQALDVLLTRFDGRGWSIPGTVVQAGDQFNDGLTLQIFATLLAAENAGVVKLPSGILEQIPRHLAECGTRSLDQKNTLTVFYSSIHNQDGKPVPNAQRHLRTLWYPWAIKCATLWHQRRETESAPHDELVRWRRVLNHLIVTLGPAAVEEVKQGGFPYAMAETLIGLSSATAPAL